jgi:hypothetical protein
MVGVRCAAAADAAVIAALMTQLDYPSSVDDAAARLGYWLAAGQSAENPSLPNADAPRADASPVPH